MNLIAAVTVALLFGSGAYLLISRDLVKITAGTVLITNAAILFLMAGGFRGLRAPIQPTPTPRLVLDPVLQALSLTAVVIGFGITALLLAVVASLERTHHTLDIRCLQESEVASEEAEETDAGEGEEEA
jgi:multicomponent Na+:H+ antiporter subunit C